MVSNVGCNFIFRRKVELLLRSNIDRVTTDAAEPGFLHAPANIFRLSLLLQVGQR